MIRFKTPLLEARFPLVHPDTRIVAREFDTWSSANGLPEPIITDVDRTPKENVAIYLPHFRRLQAALVPGPRQWMIDPEGDGTWRALTMAERQTALELRALDETALMLLAANRFSWHLARCALDFRTRHYSKEQLAKAKTWFADRCKRPDWECLAHDVTAPHIHVGRRDRAWREKYAIVRSLV